MAPQGLDRENDVAIPDLSIALVMNYILRMGYTLLAKTSLLLGLLFIICGSLESKTKH